MNVHVLRTWWLWVPRIPSRRLRNRQWICVNSRLVYSINHYRGELGLLNYEIKADSKRVSHFHFKFKFSDLVLKHERLQIKYIYSSYLVLTEQK